jgi:hypothetical protein
MYQLSHAGIHEGFHTVTWFGSLAYNKLKVVKAPKERARCPICGSDMVAVVFVGKATDRPPPSEEGCSWLPEEDWITSFDGSGSVGVVNIEPELLEAEVDRRYARFGRGP